MNIPANHLVFISRSLAPIGQRAAFAGFVLCSLLTSYEARADDSPACDRPSSVWSLTEITPSDGATNVPLNAPLFVMGTDETDEDLTPELHNGSGILKVLTVSLTRADDDMPVPGSIHVWGRREGGTWIPDAPLEPSTIYKAIFDVAAEPSATSVATGPIHREVSFTTGTDVIPPLVIAPPTSLIVSQFAQCGYVSVPDPVDSCTGIGDTQLGSATWITSISFDDVGVSHGWLSKGVEYLFVLTTSEETPAAPRSWLWNDTPPAQGYTTKPGLIEGYLCIHAFMRDAHSRAPSHAYACVENTLGPQPTTTLSCPGQADLTLPGSDGGESPAEPADAGCALSLPVGHDSDGGFFLVALGGSWLLRRRLQAVTERDTKA